MILIPVGMKTKNQPRRPQLSTHPAPLGNVSQVPSVNKLVKEPIALHDLDNPKMHRLFKMHFHLFTYLF